MFFSVTFVILVFVPLKDVCQSLFYWRVGPSELSHQWRRIEGPSQGSPEFPMFLHSHNWSLLVLLNPCWRCCTFSHSSEIESENIHQDIIVKWESEEFPSRGRIRGKNVKDTQKVTLLDCVHQTQGLVSRKTSPDHTWSNREDLYLLLWEYIDKGSCTFGGELTIRTVNLSQLNIINFRLVEPETIITQR